MTSQNERGTKRSLFVGDDEGDGTDKHGDKRMKVKQSDYTDGLASLSFNEDGKVAPYNSFASEGRPCLGIYNRSFTEAEKMAFVICQKFLEVLDQLKQEGYSNPEIENICDNNLKQFLCVRDCYPSIDPVACLGAAGHGKSSFMNCILNQLGAAHESDSGQRGTNIVHEFSAMCKGQTEKYRVAAPYYDEAQIDSLVRKHCQNIFTYLHHQTDDDYNEDEVEELRKKYDTATEFFRLMLCDRPEFNTADAADAYFESRQSDSENMVVTELKKYIEIFKDKRELQGGIEYHSAEGVDELTDVFRKVSRVPKMSTEPHPWPIIPKVQIHQDNDLLNAGVVLGDTPGVADSNHSVVDTTTNYIKGAGTILVFEKFQRITNSETLDKNLRECIRLGRMHATHLIVTMIDNGQTIKPADRVELSPEDREKLKAAEQVVSSLKSEEKVIKHGTEAAKDVEEMKKLSKALENKAVELAGAEARVAQVAIELKTREVANGLKGKFRRLDRSKTAPDLQVHFVSNSQYQKHLSGYDAKTPPILDVEGTGVPTLRRMLYTIPARGKVTTLSRICGTLLPNAFESITGILTKSRLQRKADVEKVITSVMSKKTRLVDDVTAELTTSFESQVVKVIDDNQQSWEEKTERLLRVWEKYHSGTFAAFCRHSGKWKVKKVEEFWNQKIQNITVDKLTDALNAFDDALLSLEVNTAANVGELFQQLETALEECPDFQGVQGAKSFFGRIQAIRKESVNDVKKIFGNLRGRVLGIRNMSIQYSPRAVHSSYIDEVLESTYENCKAVSKASMEAASGKQQSHSRGKVHPRRVEILRQKLKGTGGEASVFASLAELLSSRFEEQVVGWEKNDCMPKLTEAHDQVIREFNGSFVAEEEVKTEENEAAVEKLNTAVNEALAVIHGPMKKHVERFEDYEEAGGV